MSMDASYVRRHGKGKGPLNSVDSFPLASSSREELETGDTTSYLIWRDLNQTAQVVDLC